MGHAWSSIETIGGYNTDIDVGVKPEEDESKDENLEAEHDGRVEERESGKRRTTAASGTASEERREKREEQNLDRFPCAPCVFFIGFSTPPFTNNRDLCV